MRLARHDLEVGATAHRQGRSGDVAGRIGGEKDDGVANIFRLAHTAQEDAFGDCLTLLVADDSNHRRLDRPRRDRIYADAEAAPPRAGIWTIGYGHTDAVVEGMTISQIQA